MEEPKQKFKKGDVVFYRNQNWNICQDVVERVLLVAVGNGKSIYWYRLERYGSLTEDKLFATEQELRNSL